MRINKLEKFRYGLVIFGASLSILALLYSPLILIGGVSIPILNLWVEKKIEKKRQKKFEDDLTTVASYAYAFHGY